MMAHINCLIIIVNYDFPTFIISHFVECKKFNFILFIKSQEENLFNIAKCVNVINFSSSQINISISFINIHPICLKIKIFVSKDPTILVFTFASMSCNIY